MLQPLFNSTVRFLKNTRCLNRVKTDDLNIMVKTLYVVEDDTCIDLSTNGPKIQVLSK